MYTFKVGDVVRRVAHGLPTMPLGFTGKVTWVNGEHIKIEGRGIWIAGNFTLVDDQEFEGNV